MKSLRDHPVFDVSVLAGHRDWLRNRSDFSKSFVKMLNRTTIRACRGVPTMQITPSGRLHFTLRSLFGDRTPDFPRKTSKKMRQQKYAQVQTLIRKEKSWTVIWTGYALSSGGVLILKGKAQGQWLKNFRRKIDRISDRPPRFLPSSFCHITLARPRRRLTLSELSHFDNWIRENPLAKPIRMSIGNPKLMVTRNHFGTLYDKKNQRELTCRPRNGTLKAL